MVVARWHHLWTVPRSSNVGPIEHAVSKDGWKPTSLIAQPCLFQKIRQSVNWRLTMIWNCHSPPKSWSVDRCCSIHRNSWAPVPSQNQESNLTYHFQEMDGKDGLLVAKETRGAIHWWSQVIRCGLLLPDNLPTSTGCAQSLNLSIDCGQPRDCKWGSCWSPSWCMHIIAPIIAPTVYRHHFSLHLIFSF